MELIHLVPASGETRRYTLANGETIIGRRPDCRIVMDAPAIRHRHARLFSVDGSTIIHGIDDAWPVYVNGEPVQRRVLADGDEIELGPYRMRYVDGSRPERADDTATNPDPAADRDTDAPANEPVPGPFTPALDGDPRPESPSRSAGEHDENEDATPLFFGPMTATANPHESADNADQPRPASAGPDPQAAAEPTDPTWRADETLPPTDDDVDRESIIDEALPASPADEHDLQSLLNEMVPWPHPDDTDPRPADDEIGPNQNAIEPDRISVADAIDPRAVEADPGLQPRQDETEPQPAADAFDAGSAGNPMAAQAAADANDAMPSVDEAESRPVISTQQPDAGPDYHLDILTGINQGRRVTLTRDIVVLGFNRQRLVELHNEAGALTLRRIDNEAVAHLNGAPISDEPTEARPGDVISLQRIDLRIHQG